MNKQKLYICVHEDGEVYATSSLMDGEKLLDVDELHKHKELIELHPNAIFIMKQK